MSLPRVRFMVRCLVITVVGVILFLAWLILPYKASRYHGDGSITDTGFWSYPRYHIRLPPLDLSVDRKRRYSLRGTPPVPLTLSLQVVGPKPLKEKGLDSFSTLETQVSVTITDDHGKEVIALSGPLKHWVLATGGRYPEFWKPQGRDLRLREGSAYTLAVSVDGESTSPPLVLAPTLEGGGNELP